jgi:osmotically-inducible protein OsmY
MKSDADLRRDVERKLESDHHFDARDIGVAVKEGVVTLSGQLHSHIGCWAAQEAAQSVAGVAALVNEIKVKLTADGVHGDTEVAETALHALSETMATPAAEITLSVHDGWLTLRGEVAFCHEKQAAERVVRNVQGVKGVANDISVKAPQAA